METYEPAARAGEAGASAVRAARRGRFRQRGPLRIPVRVRASFLVPAVVVLLAIVIYPIFYSIWLSLHDSSGHTWVGLANFRQIFTDSATLTALRNNIVWVVSAPTLACGLGLVFAVLSERIKLSTAFKVVIFMPMAISFLAAGVIFELVYQADPHQGVANAIVKEIHDTFAPSSKYPGAHPRTGPDFTTQGSSYLTTQQYAPGSTAQLPLVGYAVGSIPKKAVQATAPSQTDPTSISGTAWLDLIYGGGGTPGHLDQGKKGLPGLTVEAVSGTKVVGKATTGNDGTFTIKGLQPGSYQLELPSSNFSQPYNGISWLGPSLVTPSIIAAYLWIWSGFAMVLIAAGLTSVPKELTESARVDGASEWQIFRKITVPLLAPVLLTVLVTLVINVLKVFDLVFIIAPGSTLPNANVLAVQMWSVSFGGAQNQALGSAIGVFLYILVLPALYFNVRRLRRERRES